MAVGVTLRIDKYLYLHVVTVAVSSQTCFGYNHMHVYGWRVKKRKKGPWRLEWSLLIQLIELDSRSTSPHVHACTATAEAHVMTTVF